jgi:hypothetical protein
MTRYELSVLFCTRCPRKCRVESPPSPAVAAAMSGRKVADVVAAAVHAWHDVVSDRRVVRIVERFPADPAGHRSSTDLRGRSCIGAATGLAPVQLAAVTAVSHDAAAVTSTSARTSHGSVLSRAPVTLTRGWVYRASWLPARSGTLRVQAVPPVRRRSARRTRPALSRPVVLVCGTLVSQPARAPACAGRF